MKPLWKEDLEALIEELAQALRGEQYDESVLTDFEKHLVDAFADFMYERSIPAGEQDRLLDLVMGRIEQGVPVVRLFYDLPGDVRGFSESSLLRRAIALYHTLKRRKSVQS